MPLGWDCHTRILTVQTIEYQYTRSQWQFMKGDRSKLWIEPQSFKKLHDNFYQPVSSRTLSNCHCAEYDKGRNLKEKLPAWNMFRFFGKAITYKGALCQKHCFWLCFKLWDCFPNPESYLAGHGLILSEQVTKHIYYCQLFNILSYGMQWQIRQVDFTK